MVYLFHNIFNSSTMKTSILMGTNEPTDKQLINLMKEVVSEAKKSAKKSQKTLEKTVLTEIKKAKKAFVVSK